MKNKDIIKKTFLALTGTVILLSLITPAIGIDQPTEPFQKVKAMALMEGIVMESKQGTRYILIIEGWGAIAYTSGSDIISLTKGTPEEYAQLDCHAKISTYFVSRKIKGSKPEVTIVDWSVATEIAYKYLREIEKVRDK